MSDTEKPSVRASSVRAWLARVLIAIVAVLGPLWARAVWDGTMALVAADDAQRRGDSVAAVEHLGHALRWRAPLSDHDEEALARLWSIAESAEQRGGAGRVAALAAYREIRRGLLATRVLDVPHRESFERANERIAVLMADPAVAVGLHETRVQAAVAEGERLARVPGPRPLLAHLASLAFVAWLVSVTGFLVWGLDEKGRLRPRPALRVGLVALVCLLGWTIALASSHGG